MLLTIIAFFSGIFFGIITGLIPGIHVNLVAILTVSFIPFLSLIFSELQIAILLISMVIIHSFLDFIPSIFLGAPEGATALSVLPGHKFLLEGKGYDALKFTICGGMGAAIFSLIFIGFLFMYFEIIYSYIKEFVVVLLILFSVIFISREKRALWASIVFLLSGILGILVLEGINIKQPLFPLLSGLFGIPVLIISLSSKTKLMKQEISDKIIVFNKRRIMCYLKASISSILVSILPAVGSAQAAIISSGFTKNNKEDFLVTVGGINTAGGLFTLTVFYLIGKARTGVMSAIQQFMSLNFYSYLALLIAGLTSVSLSVLLSLNIGKKFAKNIYRLNYSLISKIILFLISVLVLLISGVIGVWVLIASSLIGLLAPQLKIKRIHLMGCLVIPVLIYYIF